MQRPRPENGSSSRWDFLPGARALGALAAAALSLCACSGSGDKLRDAAPPSLPEAAVDAGASADAATPAPPWAGKQIIRMLPGKQIGRIALGMPLSALGSLARDFTKEEADGRVVALRKHPWYVIIKDDIAHEMTFTLDPMIWPVVANRVADSTVLKDVVELFPDCQAPTVENGLDVISCQGGQTRIERKGPDGNIVIRFVTLPPAKTKGKRPAPK